MPYIRFATSKTLDEEQKDRLKAGLADIISLIPGKTEALLMVEIDDGLTMYYAGEKRELAYIDAKFSGDTEFEYKRNFTEALIAHTQNVCELPIEAINLTYSVFDSWGARGTLMKRK